ncbi:MAG: SCP2 sterol-binding domain-containing protein [Porticoccaceae bacterium]|nr:SCP2 sterol-binding domain-containing protein [Porticoccaceae bacterium]
MIFETLHSSAISGLETAINAALKYDPGTLRDLSEIEGQVLLIDCNMPDLRIAVEAQQQQIILHPNWDGEAAVTLQGSMIALAKMAVNASDTSSFAGSGVQLSGNLETLHRLHKILSQLNIDWEGALADLVGDIPAHVIALAVRKSAKISKQSLQRATSALTEVAQEEFEIIPSKHAFKQFKHDVRQMASDTDRIMARVSALREKIDRADNGKSQA